MDVYYSIQERKYYLILQKRSYGGYNAATLYPVHKNLGYSFDKPVQRISLNEFSHSFFVLFQKPEIVFLDDLESYCRIIDASKKAFSKLLLEILDNYRNDYNLIQLKSEYEKRLSKFESSTAHIQVEPIRQILVIIDKWLAPNQGIVCRSYKASTVGRHKDAKKQGTVAHIQTDRSSEGNNLVHSETLSSTTPIHGEYIHHGFFNKTSLLDDFGEKRKALVIKRNIITHQRNSAIVSKIKALYNDTCQICGEQIAIGNNEFISEAHHIRPLKSNGDDNLNNLLLLCPNHHTMFDYGMLTIDLCQKVVLHADPKHPVNLRPITLYHRINNDNISFHNENIYKGDAKEP